ncbi:hypothetical protein [Schleiferilactobacillus shenzhenensis]|uniref:Uncharacterized protein n=1 Tax=Schleiferilactobacillus shenzhenensis LY-73 TaxID=1231336 RepID=U4TIJ6_9LACO|nr:hypothetical protein [Schleiferilactobacillus shenzhenensis]ERL64004.1 hypothetical protein L248_1651 [Schleiferilactobacillus shenzhenensis LY-73]
MNEPDNVRNALANLVELVESHDFRIGNRPATVEEVLQLIQPDVYSIADLLGMSDLYLKHEKKEGL